MSDPKGIGLTDGLHQYLLANGSRPDPVQQSLIDATAALGPIARMQIAPEQGAFMTFLVRTLGVRFAVEVGTFTGYSALAIARGLAPGGGLLCCDVSDEWTSIGRTHWAQAGVADRIDLRIAPALDTLRALPPEPTIDFAFIDADKPNYAAYFDAFGAVLGKLAEHEADRVGDFAGGIGLAHQRFSIFKTTLPPRSAPLRAACATAWRTSVSA